MWIPLMYRLAHLLRSQWLPPAELEAIQRAKLPPLIAHAYHNVPYYRRLFDTAGIKPEDIKDKTDLSQLSITTKTQLVSHPRDDLVARGIDPAGCVTLRTSGSQGMPFNVRFRRIDKAWWGLLALRGWLANGYRFRHKMLVLNDAKFAPHGTRWFEHLGLLRQNYTSMYDAIETQLERARTVRPDVIRGMTSDVYRLAQGMRERSGTSLAPKLVLTSAELMDDTTRHYINQTFGVPPTDFYGSIECGWIAWECPAHAGYHLNTEALIVEFIRDGRTVPPGEPGEIVVTNLHAYAMPFIRYSVGDVGIAGQAPCPCGRGLPLMRTVEGRIVDCLALADGRIISPYQLTCAVEQVPGIQRYQIVQTGRERLVVKLIPNRHFTSRAIPRIKAELGKLLGNGMTIEPILVQELPRDRSGKFRVVTAGGGEER